MGLDHPKILTDQFRALLRAAEGRGLSIMFPMVSEVEEFERARDYLMKTLDAHIAAGGTPPGPLAVGVMIEVPALLWDLDRLMEKVDFASVGTNDLFQFINAADRNNPKTDKRFEVLKPANLRLLSQIAEAAASHSTPLSICGELAGTPEGVTALVGCGFRSFSMNVSRVAEIKSLLCSLDSKAVRDQMRAKTGDGPEDDGSQDLDPA